MKLKPVTYKELGKTSLALMVAHIVFLMIQPLSKGIVNLKHILAGITAVLVFLLLGIILLERSEGDE